MSVKKLLVAMFASVAIISISAPMASADSGSGKAKDAQVIETPMTVKGFDRTVAEANGFRIETGPDGVERSVPVTAKAKALAETAREAKAKAKGVKVDQVVPYGSVSGSCGSSFVTAAKLSNDILAVNTGYSVYMGVWTRSWYVNAVGWIDSASFNFSGGSTGPSWSAQGAQTAVGPGVAVVPISSYVILNDGSACYSGGPTAAYG